MLCEEGGSPQIRAFNEVKERTPRRGLGQPKGTGPIANRPDEHQEGERRGKVGFYKSRPMHFRGPSEKKEYKQSEKTTDNRPPGREWSQSEEYGTGRLTVPQAPDEERDRNLSKAPPGPTKLWKDQAMERPNERVYHQNGGKRSSK